MKQYKDFTEFNRVWTWTENGFEPVHLDLLVAGDTDSSMFSLEKHFDETADIDQVCQYADSIAKKVNNSFPEFVKRAFNCPDDRKHTVQTDREIVSDKSLFLTKKRYIMHVVDKEGKRVDEKKIMGVELKKSDTSEAAKQILTDLVDWILDGVPSDEIRQRIKKIRISFADRSLQNIARPISVKGLRKYEEELRTTGSMKGFPYQARAAMYYNSLCSPSDEKIKPTDKIGVLNIKHPEYKNIAFPIDLDELPAFMYTVVYDYDLMYQKTFTKIENYLSSLGWDIKGLKDQIKKELFGF